MTEQRYLGSEVVLSSSLLLFLGFSFLVPWDALSRFFLFFISFPILLFLLFRGRVESDRILKGVVFVILATVLVNFVVGIPLERSLQSLRWGVTSLGFFVCVYISAKIWGGNGIKYGSLFFLIVILVSVFTIGFYIYNNNYPSRITGFGFMGHPIIGPGGLLVVWGVGMVLLLSGQAASWKNWMLSFISLFLVASLIFLSQSRGPLLSLLIFLVVTLVSIMLRVGTNSRVILKYAVIILGGLVIALSSGASLVERMIERGDSYRTEIYMAVISEPPENVFLGAGSAVDFSETPAGMSLKETIGVEIKHPHNVFLNVYYQSGILVLFVFVLIIGGLAVRVINNARSASVMVSGLSLLLLTLLLNTTDGSRIVAPPSSDWMFFWFPFAFLCGFYQVRSCQPKEGGLSLRNLVRG